MGGTRFFVTVDGTDVETAFRAARALRTGPTSFVFFGWASS